MTHDSKKNTFRFWYTIIACGFLVLTNASYINMALKSTDNYRYTGANQYAAADKIVYMSLIEQGREGKIFMRNVHTIEPQVGLLFSPHWFIIGQTAELFNLDNNTAYQIYRIVFTLGFLFLFFIILERLFKKTWEKSVASLFVLFSGGLGWTILAFRPDIAANLTTSQKFYVLPIDLYVTEGNTLLNFAQSPLFSLSQLMLLIIFYLYISESSQKWYINLLNGVLVALLGMMHPYDIPIILTVLGSWSVWKLYTSRSWKAISNMIYIIVGSAIAGVYNFWVVSAEPVLAEWLKQNLVFSPPFDMYLQGYGLLLLLAILGVVYGLKKKFNDPYWMLFLIWSVVIWLLLYLPIDINRRFINGYHIALSIVAFLGFRWVILATKKISLRAVIGIVAFLFLAGNAFFLLFISSYFKEDLYTSGHFYISREEDRLIDYLRDTTDTDTHIMASDMLTSFLITGQVDRLVYRGHDHQVPHSHLVKQKENWLFTDGVTPSALRNKETFLHDEDIDVLVVNRSRLEEPISWTTDVEFLTLDYESENFNVYRVNSIEDTSS